MEYMNHLVEKLENPIRLEELNPIKTLKELGVNENTVVCDIGAGSGIFSVEAAKLTKQEVYAVDVNDKLLEVIEEKKRNEKLNNLHPLLVNRFTYPIDSAKVDLALLITVFHEIEQKSEMLKEIKRILKDDGNLVIIEFIKKETPFGPPIDHRISSEEVLDVLTKNGYVLKEQKEISDNFYMMVFN